MAEIPNVVLGSEPHTDIITSAKRPNMWSLDRRPVKPGKGKKKRGSNLMDTGPDDNVGGGGAFAAPSDAQAGAEGRQALSQGIQTQGGVSPAVQQYEQSTGHWSSRRRWCKYRRGSCREPMDSVSVLMQPHLLMLPRHPQKLRQLLRHSVLLVLRLR